MKPITLLSAVAFIAGCAFNSAQANLVRNSHFDEGREMASARLVAGDTLGAWVVDRGSVDIVAKGWTPAHHLLWDGMGGPLSIDLGGSFPCPQRDGAIHQDLATIPGRVYQIKFALAGNCFGPPTVKNLVVKWNDSFAKTFLFDTAGRTNNNMGWTYCTMNVRASSQITRLTFDNPINTSYGPVIDDISVEPISDDGKIGQPVIQAADKKFDLRWLSVENEHYQIQWASSLVDPHWTDLGAPVQGTGGTMSVSDAGHDPQRYYRVVILQ